MRLLVLGGAGYVGSHTALELIENGHEVVVADNLVTGYRQAVPEKAKFYLGDVRDRDFMDWVFTKEKIDVVIHSIHAPREDEDTERPLSYYDNDFYGTKVTLDTMVDHGVQSIVFSSSSSIYGDHEGSLICEEDQQRPTNRYGEMKLNMEKLITWAANTYGLKFVFLRYFNVCGSHESGAIGEYHDRERHLIPLVLQVPSGKQEKITVNGNDYDTPDGTCIRDYIHITDLARAHLLAAEYLVKGGKSDVFNLGNGIGYSVREVIEAARRVTGHLIPSEDGPRREGDPARLVASGEKAKSVLGWKPQTTSLDDLIRSAWVWYSAHPNGYSKI